jgi:uncharacterized membrane protein YccC
MGRFGFDILTAIDANGWSLGRGIRAGLGCCVPLVLAEMLGEPALAWAAFIGFWVALVDPRWPPRTRFLTIAFFVVGTAAGCFLAVLARPYLWLSAVFAFVWCGAAMLTRAWGEAAGSSGNLLALAVLIVLELGGGSGLEAATRIAGMTVVGGLWGLVLALALGRQRPDAPVRAALARVYRTEAAFVRGLLVAASNRNGEAAGGRQRRGVVRAAIEAARVVLVRARQGWLGPGWRGRRFTLMLADADRVLEPLLALRVLLDDGVAAGSEPTEMLDAMALRLDALADAVETARDRSLPEPPLVAADTAAAISGPLHQAAAWIEAASEHLEPSTQIGEAVDPGRADTGALGRLRDNLTFASLVFRHAIRFAVVGAALTLIVNGLHLDQGYWITLAAVIVMQAYPSATWQRAIQRVAGSIGGGAIAAGAALALRGPVEVTLLAMPLSVISMSFRSANYPLYILFMTPLFILITELFHNGGVLTLSLGGLRILDNMIGASLGVAASFVLWPSWERRSLRRRLADAVRCAGCFLQAAMAGRSDAADDARLEGARRNAGLAGNNAEASLQRAMDEPHRGQDHEIAAAMTVTAVARRLGDIAAVVAQRPAGADDRARVGTLLHAELEAIASAIAAGREVASMVPPDDGAGPDIAKAWRQVSVLREATRLLAATATPATVRQAAETDARSACATVPSANKPSNS